MERRHFLRTTALFTASMAAQLPVIAGPFSGEELQSGIPADKKLDPAWVKSLFLRGESTRYRASRNELRYIGMPVGGLHSGTLYLGGDGRLWLWDIFNDNREGIEPKRFIMFTDGYPCGSWGDENYCETLFIIHGNDSIIAPFGQTAYYK